MQAKHIWLPLLILSLSACSKSGGSKSGGGGDESEFEVVDYDPELLGSCTMRMIADNSKIACFEGYGQKGVEDADFSAACSPSSIEGAAEYVTVSYASGATCDSDSQHSCMMSDPNSSSYVYLKLWDPPFDSEMANSMCNSMGAVNMVSKPASESAAASKGGKSEHSEEIQDAIQTLRLKMK